MRFVTILILLAGCGAGDGGGGGDAGVPVECAQFGQQLASIVAGHRSCQADSDCHWLSDGCLGMCNSFINTDGVDAARAVVTDASAAGCNAGCQCLALKPACNRGVCGPWMPSHGDGGI